MATILVFLPGESLGQRSLAGYSPWGRRVGHTISCDVADGHEPEHILLHQAVRPCVMQVPQPLPVV